jgi:hypothetical protein
VVINAGEERYMMYQLHNGSFISIGRGAPLYTWRACR